MSDAFYDRLFANKTIDYYEQNIIDELSVDRPDPDILEVCFFNLKAAKARLEMKIDLLEGLAVNKTMNGSC